MTATVPPSARYIKGTLLQLSMTNWQESWSASTVAKTTHAFLPEVGRTPVSTDRRLTQMLTGHGNFPHYLSVVRRRASGCCSCGVQRGDALHYVLYCPLTEAFRRDTSID